MKVYIVNGKAGAGKTTFEDFVIEMMGVYAMRISTVSLVKEVATFCGWNGKKEPKDRKFLSDLKDALTEWNDLPFKDVQNRIHSYLYSFEQFEIPTDKVAIFIDCREPQEIDRLKQFYNGKTICVLRTLENYHPSNHADADTDNYKYDIYIENNEDLKQLYEAAENFIRTENLK